MRKRKNSLAATQEQLLNQLEEEILRNAVVLADMRQVQNENIKQYLGILRSNKRQAILNFLEEGKTEQKFGNCRLIMDCMKDDESNLKAIILNERRKILGAEARPSEE